MASLTLTVPAGQQSARGHACSLALTTPAGQQSVRCQLARGLMVPSELFYEALFTSKENAFNCRFVALKKGPTSKIITRFVLFHSN